MRKSDAIEMLRGAGITPRELADQIEFVSGQDILENEAEDLIEWIADRLADEEEG